MPNTDATKVLARRLQAVTNLTYAQARTRIETTDDPHTAVLLEEIRHAATNAITANARYSSAVAAATARVERHAHNSPFPPPPAMTPTITAAIQAVNMGCRSVLVAGPSGMDGPHLEISAPDFDYGFFWRHRDMLAIVAMADFRHDGSPIRAHDAVRDPTRTHLLDAVSWIVDAYCTNPLIKPADRPEAATPLLHDSFDVLRPRPHSPGGRSALTDVCARLTQPEALAVTLAFTNMVGAGTDDVLSIAADSDALIAHTEAGWDDGTYDTAVDTYGKEAVRWATQALAITLGFQPPTADDVDAFLARPVGPMIY